MNEGTLALMIPIFSVIGGIAIVIVAIVTDYRKKTQMIEKGMENNANMLSGLIDIAQIRINEILNGKKAALKPDNNAKYFDERQLLYFRNEDFDLLYPGYGDTYPTYKGAIGMTYEKAGSGAGGLPAGGIVFLCRKTDHPKTRPRYWWTAAYRAQPE